nr:hypothetical protein [Pyrinomonadaceae bacterium]
MKKILGITALFVLAASVVFIFIGGKAQAGKNVFENGSQDELERAKTISLEILRGQASQRAIGNVDEYQVSKVEIDELRMAHTKVRQTYQGVPVWEGEAIVHLKSDGSLSTITDSLKDNIALANVQPNFSEKAAISHAVRQDASRAKMTDSPIVELFVYRGEIQDHLVYRVEIPRIDGSDETSAPVIFVDAHTGVKVFEYNNLKTGTGSSLYSGTVNISTTSSAGTFYMEDTTRRMGTFNMNSTGNETTGTGGTQSRFTDTDDNWNTTIQRAGVDAHYGAAQTFDYYQAVHGRNGIN